MEAMGIDLGILLETKLTGGIYTQNSSGYSVIASDAPNVHQGGIALFWQANKMYEVKDWRICGPNVPSFVMVTGSQRFYAVGCYIPPRLVLILAGAVCNVWVFLCTRRRCVPIFYCNL
jgi:hypothetical protein